MKTQKPTDFSLSGWLSLPMALFGTTPCSHLNALRRSGHFHFLPVLYRPVDSGLALTYSGSDCYLMRHLSDAIVVSKLVLFFGYDLVSLLSDVEKVIWADLNSRHQLVVPLYTNGISALIYARLPIGIIFWSGTDTQLKKLLPGILEKWTHQCTLKFI